MLHLETLGQRPERRVPDAVLHLQPAPQPWLRHREFVPMLACCSVVCRHLPALTHTACFPIWHKVLCCVDKQGVLSWPNPSPETVLFFSGRVEPPHDSQDDLRDDLSVGSFCRTEGEEDREEVCNTEELVGSENSGCSSR